MKTKQKLLSAAALSLLLLSGCAVPYDDVGYSGSDLHPMY
jgi:PBP1b-binding outer membrane lipoprotein LpoB